MSQEHQRLSASDSNVVPHTCNCRCPTLVPNLSHTCHVVSVSGKSSDLLVRPNVSNAKRSKSDTTPTTCGGAGGCHPWHRADSIRITAYGCNYRILCLPNLAHHLLYGCERPFFGPHFSTPHFVVPCSALRPEPSMAPYIHLLNDSHLVVLVHNGETSHPVLHEQLQCCGG